MIHTMQQYSPQQYSKASHAQTTQHAVHKASIHKDATLCTFPPTTSTASFPPTTSMSFRYYQPPKQPTYSDSEEYSSDEGHKQNGRRRQDSTDNNTGTKRTGACTHCKTLKVKCHFTPGQAACNRCQVSKLNCTVHGRKKRRAVPTHEELLRKSHSQDVEISTLLQRIDAMTTERNIQEWVSRSRPGSRNPSESSSKGSDMGVEVSQLPLDTWSNLSHFEDYPRRHLTKEELYAHFPDGSYDLNATVPAVISCGLLSPYEVSQLFTLYFEVVNPFFSILDPNLHSASRLFWKSHFLFTVICAVASRFFEERPSIHASLFEFAKDCCGKALVGNEKTVDNCQAFLLMAVYQLPRRRYEEQRGWLYMGIAFRLALELKLNEPCDHSVNERERLNRMRTWLNCYCVDASHATQFGKPAMIAVEDYVARQSRNWYRTSQLNLPMDIHLVAYVEVLQTMGRFKKDAGDLSTNNDAVAANSLRLSRRYNGYLLQLLAEWTRRFNEDDSRIPYCKYRADLHRMINSYSRLVVLVFGFQKSVAFKKGAQLVNPNELRENVRLCVETACEVIRRLVEDLAPSGYLRYGMEAHFLFVSFAAAFLVNLLKPKFQSLLDQAQRASIPSRVDELIRVLRSDLVSKDHGHAPQSPLIYARFLHALCVRTVPQGFSAISTAETPHIHAHTTAHTDGDSGNWAYTDSRPTFYNYSNGGYRDNAVDPALQYTGIEMDFSLNNFLQTISAQPQLQQPSPPPGSGTNYWPGNVALDNQTLSNAFIWPMVTGSNPSPPQQYNGEYT